MIRFAFTMGQPDRSGRTKFSAFLPLLTALIAFVVYLLTICPTVYTEGTGENITAAALLGVPHPPGFPLFCILGKLFCVIIPIGSIAFRVNLFSATCAAAAVGVLTATLQKMEIRPAFTAATTSALIFAFSRTFWSQAVIAEVYTLNILILTSILYLVLHWENGGRLWPVALFAGLGLTVHPTQIFFFPGWLILIATSPRKTGINRRTLVNCAIAFAAALSLHFYPWIRSKANPILDWGNPETLKGWIAYLTASQYRGRMFTIPIADVAANLLKGINQLLQEVSRWTAGIPIVGAILLFRASRRIFYATATSLFLALVFAINYDIPWEIEVYYIPIVFVLAIWTATVFAAIIDYAPYAKWLILLLCLIPLIRNYSVNDLSKNQITLAYAEDVLATCPPNSTLIVPNTRLAAVMFYLRGVEHARPDVAIWISGFGGVSRLENAVNPRVPKISELHLLSSAKSPVLQSFRLPPESIPGFTQWPYGIAYRVVPGKDLLKALPLKLPVYRIVAYKLPSHSLDENSRFLLASFLMSQGDSYAFRGSTADAERYYRSADQIGAGAPEVLAELGMRYRALGQPEKALQFFGASLLQRDNSLAYYQVGEILVETGRDDQAHTAFQRAIELNPGMAIAHQALGKLLLRKKDVKSAVKELKLAVDLDPYNSVSATDLKLATNSTQ